MLVCAGPGVVEALTNVGLTLVREPPAAAVVVGFHRDFDYEELERASRAVREGARFVATNLDPTYPTADGMIPGTGALVAAVAIASSATPEVAGKPEQPTVALVHQRLGTTGRDGGGPPLDRRRDGRRARLALRARAVGGHRRRSRRRAAKRSRRPRLRTSPPTSASSHPGSWLP